MNRRERSRMLMLADLANEVMYDSCYYVEGKDDFLDFLLLEVSRWGSAIMEDEENEK